MNISLNTFHCIFMKSVFEGIQFQWNRNFQVEGALRYYDKPFITAEIEVERDEGFF